MMKYFADIPIIGTSETVRALVDYIDGERAMCVEGQTLTTELGGIGFYTHQDEDGGVSATQTCGERLTDEEWASLHNAGLLPSRRRE